MGIIGAAVLGAAIAIKCGRKIEEAIAPAIILITLIIYLPGLVFSLTPGFIAALMLIAVSAVYVVFKLIRDRDAFISAVCTPGGAAFLFFVLFFAYYSLHRDFSHPDELYSWGLIVKSYISLDSMKSQAFTIMLDTQPPLLALWEYLSAKMWPGFSDGICYFAHHMFTISLLLPVFAHLKKKADLAMFIILVLMLPSLLVLSGLDGFGYILADMVIAAQICAYMMYVFGFIRNAGERNASGYVSGRLIRDPDLIASVLILVSLCLTKRTGVIFASLCIFCVAGAMLKASIRNMRPLVISLIAISLTVVSWEHATLYGLVTRMIFVVLSAIYVVYRYLLTRYDRHARIIDTAALLCVLGASGLIAVWLSRTEYGAAVMARFMHDLFSISLGTELKTGFVVLSYGFFMLIALFVYFGMDKEDENAYIRPVIMCVVISMVIYAVIMLYEHIHEIGPMNEMRESIIPRYMIPWEITVVFLALYVLVIRDKDTGVCRMLIVLAILFVISDTGSLYRGLFSRHHCIGYHALEDAGITPAEGDMIYFIDEQNYFSYSDREFYYCMFPATTNFVDEIFLGNNGRLEMDADSLESHIASDQYLGVPYDYLYLQTYDDDFADRYGSLFENPADIAPGTAYYVITDGTDVTLRRVDR